MTRVPNPNGSPLNLAESQEVLKELAQNLYTFQVASKAVLFLEKL